MGCVPAVLFDYDVNSEVTVAVGDAAPTVVAADTNSGDPGTDPA